MWILYRIHLCFVRAFPWGDVQECPESTAASTAPSLLPIWLSLQMGSRRDVVLFSSPTANPVTTCLQSAPFDYGVYQSLGGLIHLAIAPHPVPMSQDWNMLRGIRLPTG